MANVDKGFRSYVQPGSGQGAKRSRCTESQDEASFLPKAVGAVTRRVWPTSILVAQLRLALIEGRSKRLYSYASASLEKNEFQPN